MKLQSEEHIALTLEIAGYRSPEIVDRFWDANWLIVRCRIEHPRGGWSFSEPSLATFELEQLARWFDGVAQASPDPKAGYFTESHLTFLYAPPPVSVIEVRFAFEAAPPWLVDRNLRTRRRRPQLSSGAQRPPRVRPESARAARALSPTRLSALTVVLRERVRTREAKSAFT